MTETGPVSFQTQKDDAVADRYVAYHEHTRAVSVCMHDGEHTGEVVLAVGPF